VLSLPRFWLFRLVVVERVLGPPVHVAPPPVETTT
jgi:hypothetical protein